MNREMNCRLWDKEDKYMIPSEQVLIINFAEEIVTIEINENGDESDYPFSRFIFMWNTGLCDKEGNKIFEGDIVEVSDEYGNEYREPQIVEYSCGMFTTNYLSSHGKPLYICEDIKIIGNIHDDPELFKGE